MKELHLNIVSPEKEAFNGEVKSVTLPGTSGVFSILPQHAPIVSSLQEGTVSSRQRMAKSIRWIFTAVLWS